MKKTLLALASAGAVFSFFACSGNSGSTTAQISDPTYSETIKVDQFGYLPDEQKIAIVSRAVTGYDAHSDYVFTPGDTYELHHAEEGELAYSGAVTAFNAGATDAASGDKVWYFDFSDYNGTGMFYVYDPVNKIASYPFEIGTGVYRDVLVQAVRTFFYQRIGFTKSAAYAGSRWEDNASHLQDATCLFVDDNTTPLDLSGGWYDAGDFNKYVNFADGALHDLLFAYQENPAAFGDDYNIPESGNGVADLLDEVKYELDWLLRMQRTEGYLLHKVASTSWDATTPPSTDTVPRRYSLASQSATASGAGAFAHAALVFADINATYAAQLQNAARLAWSWLVNNSDYAEFDNGSFVNAPAEDSTAAQKMNRLNAAIYLFALDHNTTLHDYIEAHYQEATMMDETNGGYLMPDGLTEESQNALLFYAALPEANATLAASIQSTYMELLDSPYNDFAPYYQHSSDGYLAPIDVYTWGSNRGKSHAGSALYNPIAYGISESNTTLKNMAAHYLHYLHGRNPMNLVYLSNMGEFGAEASVDQFYHMWFRDGSVWDSTLDSYGPPPGYMVGGPNENYSGNARMAGSTQGITEQPAAKSYRSWNTVDDDVSYEITENSITYQAAYIRLLSKFVPEP